MCDQRIVFLGAGSAAVGIADMIFASMIEEGLSKEEARKKFWFLDSKGLVTTTRGDELAEHNIPYARSGKFLLRLQLPYVKLHISKVLPGKRDLMICWLMSKVKCSNPSDLLIKLFEN